MMLSVLVFLAGKVISPQAPPRGPHPQVVAYYFPGYHPDPRNDVRKGRGWTEWNLVRSAVPRFPGHGQPRIPLWGYQDESQPNAMAQKIDAASSAGIDAFIFDWYWYEDKPFLNRALDRGFLKAKNKKRLKFALMWANHDWLDIMPAHKNKPLPLIYKGNVDGKIFGHVMNAAIGYFRQPNYWRVGGKPYFSIYEVPTLVKGLGGETRTREALDQFRAKVRASGFPGLHLNAVGWGSLTPKTVKKLGFDSVSDYVWVHHLAPEAYPGWARKSEAQWPEFQTRWPVPYFPNVSVGWDNTPRFSWLTNVNWSTPAEYEEALSKAEQYLATVKGPKVLTLNSWNEWTEGGYLEPDRKNGYGYLKAIKKVFVGEARSTPDR